MGCGTEKPKKEEDRLAKLLIGSWRGRAVFDDAAVRKRLAKQGLSKSRIDLAIPLVKKKYNEMEVLWTFTENQCELVFFKSNFGDRFEGAWKFISSTEDTLTIKTIEDNGAESELKLRFEGDDEFTMEYTSKRVNIPRFTYRFKRTKVGPQKYKPRKR